MATAGATASRRFSSSAGWLLILAVGTDSLGAQEGFPHPAHEGLFPVCAGCHPAAESEGADRMYPPTSVCGNCHDGAQAAAVRWTPPARPRSDFRHVHHLRATESAGSVIGCHDCHGKAGEGRMEVLAVTAGDACVGCHAEHRADSDCRRCHTGAASDHDLAAHSGCNSCHGEVRVDELPLTRKFCLLCHVDLADHQAPGDCVACHPVR